MSNGSRIFATLRHSCHPRLLKNGSQGPAYYNRNRYKSNINKDLERAKELLRFAITREERLTITGHGKEEAEALLEQFPLIK